MIINTKTKLLGLLGYPLGHSLSPTIHNAAFEELSLNKIYIPMEVVPENLEKVVSGISKMNFEGFNITIPYKIDIINYLDEMDDYAKYIGAVNTVTIKNGTMKGYNTDGTGFMKSFKEGSDTDIKGKNIFIMGSGGAARAISMASAMNGANKIYICNRTIEKAERLSGEIVNLTEVKSSVVPMVYEEIERFIKDADILINCTSIGMYPNVTNTPLDKRLLHSDLIVCDAVYNPRKTRLLMDAEEIGCKTVTGLAMLIYQGAEAFELWTGKKAPVDLMFKVAEEQF